jgi:hypothetical protein
MLAMKNRHISSKAILEVPLVIEKTLTLIDPRFRILIRKTFKDF